MPHIALLIGLLTFFVIVRKCLGFGPILSFEAKAAILVGFLLISVCLIVSSIIWFLIGVVGPSMYGFSK